MRPWAGHFISLGLCLKWVVGGHPSHGAPASANIPRLSGLDTTVQLFLWLPRDEDPLTSESHTQTLWKSYILQVWLEETTRQAKSAHLPRSLLSSISNLNTNEFALHILCTVLGTVWGMGKSDFCPWSDDDAGMNFLLIADEVSGPALNALLIFSPSILTKSQWALFNHPIWKPPSPPYPAVVFSIAFPFIKK